MDINIFNVLIIFAFIVSGIIISVRTQENSTQTILRYIGVASVLMGLTITAYVILGSLPIWVSTLVLALLVIFIHEISNTSIDK